MIFIYFRAWMPENCKGRPAAPIERFTRYQLAAIMVFLCFPKILIVMKDFQDNGNWRPVALIESSTRFQLAVIIDFH